MKVQSKRLFINNLPDNITQSDLEQKFGHYGTVASVEIKQRKNINAEQTAQFAYIQLNIENNYLEDCINEFSNKKWKGHWIEVQEAKESFMERLKREREELKVNGVLKTTSTSIPIHSPDLNSGSKTISTVNVKKYHSSSSESSSDDEQDSGFVSNSGKQRKTIVENGSVSVPNEDLDGFVIKNNKGARIKGGLKIESVIGVKPPVKVVENEAKKFGAKETEADKKRLQSMVQMRKGYQQQKSLIKNALSNIDSKPKNKIVFDDDAEIATPSKRGRLDGKADLKTKHKTKTAQNNFALFEDEENENDHEEQYNFEVKEHFEGKKGQQLMKLQSRFKNDKRFAMDARFLEDQSGEESGDEEEQNENQDEDVEISQEQETQQQYEILEEVLGKKVTRRGTDKDTTESKRHKMMLRFDPSQPEHSKYEMKEPEKQEKVKKKRKNSDRETEIETVEEAPKPEVSKDTFYKVAVDLKDALHEKEGFSLANMFSKEIQDEEEEEQTKDTSATAKQQKTLSHEENPFRYDSSSDEEDNEKTENSATADDGTKAAAAQLERTKPTRLWTESFFFKDDDYRLQEGLDFIKRLEVDDAGDFFKLRRNLKEVIRAKVKNNQRKNRPFKRKLGGKKRLRVKRAMKR